MKVTPSHAARRVGAAGHPPAYPALLVVGVVVLAASLRAALTAVGPLAGEIRADTGVSSGVLGLVTTLPLLAFGVLSPPAPRLGRRFGIERALRDRAGAAGEPAAGACGDPAAVGGRCGAHGWPGR